MVGRAAVYTCTQCPRGRHRGSAVSRGCPEEGLTLRLSRNLTEKATSRLTFTNVFRFLKIHPVCDSTVIIMSGPSPTFSVPTGYN